MTPAARVQAAIDCLEAVLTGTPAEQALTRWARGARYAGSGDRRAVRDHVYDVLRRRLSAAWVGGGEDARALMIGSLVLDEADLPALFTGEGHAPAPLLPDEGRGVLDMAPAAVQADLPEWLWPRLVAQYGEAAALALGQAQRSRAAPWLRVNLARTTREAAMAALAADSIPTQPHPQVETALEVTGRAHGLRGAQAYLGGLVELQDASSQAAVSHLPLRPGMRVLDYCAGGGGKALAIAARTGGPVHAHDADPARMRDIAPRAARAGADIRILHDPMDKGPFDLVLVDAPCSGSGTWRRTPDAKWRLTPARLTELTTLQERIARQAMALVAPGGMFAWMTCSILEEENAGRIHAIMAETGWQLIDSHSWTPDLLGDGFYLAVMKNT